MDHKPTDILRLLIINDGWNPIMKGEKVPTLEVDQRNSLENLPEFLEAISDVLASPDRVKGDTMRDVVLRIDLETRGASREKKTEIERKLFHQIKKTTGEATRILFLVHTRENREELYPQTINRLKDKAQAGAYSNLQGIIYGKNGGLIASKRYLINPRGVKVAEWAGEEENHYWIDEERFNKVWNTYFHSLKDRVFDLKSQFRVIEAYGDLSWKDTNLGKRIGREIQQFEQYLQEKAANPEGEEAASENSSHKVFSEIQRDVLFVKQDFDRLTMEEGSPRDTWNNINQRLSSITQKVI